MKASQQTIDTWGRVMRYRDLDVLSKKLKLTKSTLSRILHGKQGTKPEKLIEINKFLYEIAEKRYQSVQDELKRSEERLGEFR